MNVPAELRPRFDAAMREKLDETNVLRKQVAAFAADVHRRADADEIDVDLEDVDNIADALEQLLKKVSRKTTPLHHRLIHTTARVCILGPDDGRPLTDERLRQDVALVNEAIRVVRRPELTIR